jgi:hypothetical protein
MSDYQRVACIQRGFHRDFSWYIWATDILEELWIVRHILDLAHDFF